jgi:hypothetical protein
VLNPVDDGGFASWARYVVGLDVLSPEELQRVLSRRYPRVAVHRRELSDENVEIWYVYRDGRWTMPSAAMKGAHERAQ